MYRTPQCVPSPVHALHEIDRFGFPPGLFLATSYSVKYYCRGFGEKVRTFCKLSELLADPVTICFFVEYTYLNEETVYRS